jgi:hypothetical protein
MLTINNIEKILSINSQNIEVIHFQEYKYFYEFEFIDDNIHSTTFKVHMHREPESGHKHSYTLQLWDGISNNTLGYNFGLHDVKDPFTLLSYLHDVINDWDNVTNK